MNFKTELKAMRELDVDTMGHVIDLYCAWDHRLYGILRHGFYLGFRFAVSVVDSAAPFGSKGKMIGKLKKVNAHHHDPDTQSYDTILGGCAPEWIFYFFHNPCFPVGKLTPFAARGCIVIIISMLHFNHIIIAKCYKCNHLFC